MSNYKSVVVSKKKNVNKEKQSITNKKGRKFVEEVGKLVFFPRHVTNSFMQLGHKFPLLYYIESRPDSSVFYQLLLNKTILHIFILIKNLPQHTAPPKVLYKQYLLFE